MGFVSVGFCLEEPVLETRCMYALERFCAVIDDCCRFGAFLCSIAIAIAIAYVL